MSVPGNSSASDNPKTACPKTASNKIWHRLFPVHAGTYNSVLYNLGLGWPLAKHKLTASSGFSAAGYLGLGGITINKQIVAASTNHLQSGQICMSPSDKPCTFLLLVWVLSSIGIKFSKLHMLAQTVDYRQDRRAVKLPASVPRIAHQSRYNSSLLSCLAILMVKQ